MSSQVLIILGNGFDVALQYPTRYKDFYNNSSALRQYASSGNKLCKHIIETYTDENTLWSDLEEGLYNYSLNLTKEYGEGNNAVATDFRNEFNELRSALFSYLHSISSEAKLIVKQTPIIGLNLEWKKVNPQYMTFNYSTTTLATASGNGREFLNYDDSINSEKFIYQHGSIYNPKDACTNAPNSIVLGIDEDVQKVEYLHSFLYKSHQCPYNLKEVMQLIDKKSLYIIYGCSVGDSDALYFKRIFNQKNKQYIIYYYDENALITIKANIAKMCNSYAQFEIENSVNFLSIKDEINSRNRTRDLLKTYCG